MPIMVPPVGSHGLAHVVKGGRHRQGDVRAVGTLMTDLDAVEPQHGGDRLHNPGPKWFQLYVPDDRGVVRELLQRAKAAGYTAVRADHRQPLRYPREENIRNEFRPPRSLGKGNAPRSMDLAAAIAALDNSKRDLDWDDLDFIKQSPDCQ